MPYPTDHSPIVYLERRIIYYKKKRGKINNYLAGKKYKMVGDRKITKAHIDVAVKKINDRIQEYQKSIDILKK